MPSGSSHYTVASSFYGTLEGTEVHYAEGEVVDADDPALKEWPNYFVPLVVREHPPAATPKARKAEAPVELATAAPGEQRETSGKAMTNAALKGKAN